MKHIIPTRMFYTAASALLLFSPGRAMADARLATIFGKGMVLQQKKPVPIWGWADPGEEVTVKIAGQTATTKAGASGTWKVVLTPLRVGKPLELAVNAKNLITVSDVLVGEVWLCSGQSNMETTMHESGRFIVPELALPPNPNLRMFRVGRGYSENPEGEIRGGSWQSASPNTIPGFCATAYQFGKNLQKELNIPVGLIASTIGGTPAQAWISRSKLYSDPETHAIAEGEIQTTQQGIEANKLLAKDDKQRYPDWKILATSGYLFNAMIHPLVPYGIAGFAWYQGEANETNPEPYRKLFPQLITEWRECWGDPNLPFIFCQLPGTKLGPPNVGKRPFLRAAQASALSLPNTGMAVLIDTGEEMSNHPRDKAPVGERLARIALAKTYGKKLEFSGPVFVGAEFAGGKAIVRFNNTAGGLTSKTLPASHQPDTLKPEWKPLIRNSPNSQVEGFALAGSDRQWVWADARIAGDSVLVSAPTVLNPVAVRYAWSDFPICNLYNGAGLPSAPFRTDGWPWTLQTQSP
jgi:sialate O-acetylesterase